VNRKAAAFGGAALAFAASRSTQGSTRAAFEAAAAASLCLGIVEVLKELRPALLFGNAPRRAQTPVAPATPAARGVSAEKARAEAEARASERQATYTRSSIK